MDADTLRTLAARLEADREFIRNEEMTKQVLVIPFVKALGYNPSNPREVRLEYTAQFTANDGKRLPDRMDVAIFDATGTRHLLVIETKPLGADLQVRSPQLARYMGQLQDLRFGIMSDGCSYHFFGDLAKPNIMDETPFFSFSLDDPKLDHEEVARFLSKFSRERFNATNLVTEAEDANYRQLMVSKLVRALRDPSSDDSFLRWITEGVYEGKRTKQVMERLTRVAKEAVKPSIMSTLSDDFLDGLREQMREAVGRTDSSAGQEAPTEVTTTDHDDSAQSSGVVTTDEEHEFADLVRQACVEAGEDPEMILVKDTTNYFNVSFRTPTRWFARFLVMKNRKVIVTRVPSEEARTLAPGYQIEDAPAAFGVSRVDVDSVEAARELGPLLLRSLAIAK